MRETRVRHFGVFGYIVLRKSPVLRAILFVATIYVVAATGCAIATPTPTPFSGPPQVPHSLEGREGQCLLCHEEGVAGAPRVSVNHAGRTSDICTLCHVQADASAHSPGVTPTPTRSSGTPQIPHSLTPNATPAATGTKPADPTHGEAVYNTTCSACHGKDRKGTPIAPALNTAGLAAKFPADSALADVIRKGVGIMPGFDKLSAADLADLVAYLRSIQPVTSGTPTTTPTTTTPTTTPTTTGTKPADPTHGEAVYNATCSACHGKDRTGTPIAPALNTAGFAAKFAAGSALVDVIRKGAGIMPGFDKLSDADLADLVAYLRAIR